MPDALREVLKDTVTLVLEFIIHTLQNSPMPKKFGSLPATRDQLKNIGPSGEPMERRMNGPWAVTGWADDKHVLKEVTRQFRDALGVTMSVAEKYAKEMDEVVSVLCCAAMLLHCQVRTGASR
jgi:E3 ubiquitin-protein ligase UBR1